MKRFNRFLLLVSILISFLSLKIYAQSLETKSFFSKSLDRDWRFNLYLPPEYDNGNCYSIIYLLHGSGGNETDWNPGIKLIDSLIINGVISPLIAVAPSSGTSWWVNGIENFESAFFNDLVPHIENTYQVYNQKNKRFIAGFSMGGYGALRYSLTHPDLFSVAILLSPALYDELPPPGSSARESGAFGKPFDENLWVQKNYPTILLKSNNDKEKVLLIITAGDDDWNHPEGTKYNIDWQANILFSKYNKELGAPAELRIYNGSHNWDLWQKALYESLLMLEN